MKHYRDAITVGKVKCMYSVLHRGWLMPSGEVVRNPLKAQRLAEELDTKKRCAMTDYGGSKTPKMNVTTGKRRLKFSTRSIASLASGWMLQPLRVTRYALTISLSWMTR